MNVERRRNLLVTGARVFFFLGMCFASAAARADYVAYAVVEQGPKPLPENIDGIDAKYLVNIKWGEYTGNKVRVGVLEVQNDSNVGTFRMVGPGGAVVSYSAGQGVPVQGIESILTDVLHRTGRFRVVERTMLDRTLKEQDLGASGRISKPSAAKIGKVLGAQYLIQAVVTHYEPDYEGKDIGIGGLLPGAAGALLGGLKIKSRKSMVGMNFRLIDAETSEVVFTKQVEAVMSESGLSFGGFGAGSGGALGGFLSSYSKTPIGQAVIAAVNKGVYELVKQVGTAPASGSVVRVKGGKVYLNLGAGRVAVGERLTLYSKGEELIDPETGLSLGGEEEEIGVLEVTVVKPKYSIARPVGVSASRIKTGDKVVSSRQPEGLRFAAVWEPPGGSSYASAGQEDSGGDGSEEEEEE